MTTLLQLYFDDIHVADVRVIGRTVDTWDGLFSIVMSGKSPLEQRLAEFIAVTTEWFRCLSATPPSQSDDPDEYTDLIESSSWCMKSPDGSSSLPLQMAPAFMPEDCLQWMYR